MATIEDDNEPEWLVWSQDSLTPEKYNQIIEILRHNAKKQGKVVGVVEHTNRRGEILSYTVSIEQKNPAYRGGRKGAGKRRFLK